MTARDLVNKQAEDAGLWFMAQTAPEAYLQRALRQLHAAVEYAQPSPEWQPIETAPKDGTEIILGYAGVIAAGDAAVRTGHWLDNSKTSIPWAGWKFTGMRPSRWLVPTHWQPLPNPPEST